jgi:hypothetical protein
MRFAETAREIAANSSCVIRMHHLNKNEFKFSSCGKTRRVMPAADLLQSYAFEWARGRYGRGGPSLVLQPSKGDARGRDEVNLTPVCAPDRPL